MSTEEGYHEAENESQREGGGKKEPRGIIASKKAATEGSAQQAMHNLRCPSEPQGPPNVFAALQSYKQKAPALLSPALVMPKDSKLSFRIDETCMYSSPVACGRHSIYL